MADHHMSGSALWVAHREAARLQTELLRQLSSTFSLGEVLQMVVNRLAADLDASAASVYVVGKPDATGNRTASMLAGTGYQMPFVGRGCRVIPPEAVPALPSDEQRLGLTGWVISTGQALCASRPEEVQAHPHWSGRHDQEQAPGGRLELSGFLAAPLWDAHGQTIGALKAERVISPQRRPRPFSSADQLTLEMYAAVASRCIAYMGDIEAEGAAAQAVTSWARQVIHEAVGAEAELDEFLDLVVQIVAAATDADSCAVFLRDPEGKSLTQRAGCGHQRQRLLIRSYRLPDAERIEACLQHLGCSPATCTAERPQRKEDRAGLTAWVAATGKSFYARNRRELRDHCHWQGRFDPQNFDPEDGKECGAWMGVPLRAGGDITGVLKIENAVDRGETHCRGFDGNQQRRLEVLAHEVALAIERWQVQSRARYQPIGRAMPAIQGILTRQWEVPDLAKTVVTVTAESLKAKACALFLMDGEGELAQPEWSAYGWARKGPWIRRYRLVPEAAIKDNPTREERVGLTVWLAAKHRPDSDSVFTAKSQMELRAHPHHRGEYDPYNFVGAEGCESFMGTALRVEDELVGVLKVETKLRHVGDQEEYTYFSEVDEIVFRLIANSAAIAIKNARQFEESRLARDVLAQPSANQVLEHLCRFMMPLTDSPPRVDLPRTFAAVARDVGAGDAAKANLVATVAAALGAGGDPAVIHALAEQLADPLAKVLAWCAHALEVRNLDHIHSLPACPLLAPLLVGHFMQGLASSLNSTLPPVRDALERYRMDDRQRQALLEARAALERAKEMAAKDGPFRPEDEHEARALGPLDRALLGPLYERWLGIVEEEVRVWRFLDSPYRAGMPLEANSPVFVGREDVFDWLGSNLGQGILVLHGGQRTGKTSILLQLEQGDLGQRVREQRGAPVVPVYVDMLRRNDPGEGAFLRLLAQTVADRLAARDLLSSPVALPSFKTGPRAAFEGFLGKIRGALRSGEQSSLLLMVDEFEQLEKWITDGSADADTFDYLRGMIQAERRLALIVAGHRDLARISIERRHRLFGVAAHRSIGKLPQPAAERLVRDPVVPLGVTYEDSAVACLLRLSGRHPFFTQRLCHACLDVLNTERSGLQIGQSQLSAAIELCLGAGQEDTLLVYWAEAGEAGQEVLRAISRLGGPAGDWVEYRDLAKERPGEEAALGSVLRELERQEVLECDRGTGGQPTRCRYQIDLLRVWAQRNEPSARPS